MAAARGRRARPARRRVGRVSCYRHHGGWWIYYRESGRPVRRRVGESFEEAERVAAQVNAQLASESPTLFSFEPVDVAELRRRFLAHHENVQRSSVATISRYRAATQHLKDYAATLGLNVPAHTVRADCFAAWLRQRQVSPNGHAHTARRPLRDKGVRFVLCTCRSLYGFAQRMRHLPPYAPNTFSDLRIDRMRVTDAKPVFVFTAETELKFLQVADTWEFPIHAVLAKTGLRPGELVHLLVEDLDLDRGWLQVSNKTELGWRIKTGTERSVPLLPELCRLLRAVVGNRTAGPVFLQRRFESGRVLLAPLSRHDLARLLNERRQAAEQTLFRQLTREEQLRLAAKVWRGAGAIDTDDIRKSFIRVARRASLADATCPKSWRHSLATVMQDANVDPLIRQLTLGHRPTVTSSGLGMTTTYTHTRPETQKAAIDRALRLWPQSLDLVNQRSKQECKS